MIGTNSVVDLSHHNGGPDLQRANASGTMWVIQKTTQGASFTDPTFASNLKTASDAGLLFGAYHFGVGAEGMEQADFFFSATFLGLMGVNSGTYIGFKFPEQKNPSQ
jgi:lysozyme